MGVFARSVKAGVGWPNPGWAPPYGWTGDSIATTVNQNTAMSVSAFTAGIRLIAEDLAHLPLITYKRLEKGKERATDHPAYALLHDAPNPEMTSMVFRETGIAHMYSWGNWYAEKELNGDGVPVRLWPLRPDKMERTVIKEGKRFYPYTLPDGSRVMIPAARMFHVPGWGFDGLVGYSRVTLMRRALESAIVAAEYGLRTLANDARPGVTIKHPNQLSPTAKKNIAESWDEAHQGLSNAQRTAVLDEGMTLEATGFSPEDAQYLDSRKFSTIEIAQGLRLPPHKLSDLENAHFTNIEESNIDYVVGTLGPPASRIEQQIQKDIIGDPGYFAEHLFEKLLRGKTLDRFNAYRIATNGAAWMNADDVAEAENRKPLPDGKGQVYLAPLNSSPVELLASAVLDHQVTPGKDEEPQETKAPDVHLHIDAGAFVNHIHTPPVTIAKGAVQVDHKAGDVNVAAPPTTVVPPSVVNVPPTPEPRRVTKTVKRNDKGEIVALVETTDGE